LKFHLTNCHDGNLKSVIYSSLKEMEVQTKLGVLLCIVEN